MTIFFEILFPVLCVIGGGIAHELDMRRCIKRDGYCTGFFGKIIGTVDGSNKEHANR